MDENAMLVSQSPVGFEIRSAQGTEEQRNLVTEQLQAMEAQM